ncbi:MAG TPA: protein-tyrosine-phosphatase [Stellaceae bacterium]|nr:protein-tyrosine-phosphatase [Stellaceae bacterium]
MDRVPIAHFRASICGIEELESHSAGGVTHVLSLLDPGWPAPAAFGGFGAHERLDLRFHDVVDPLPGLRPPRPEDVAALLRFAAGMAAASQLHLLVHCQKGLSRSTASLALILAQARPDLAADDVLAEVVRLRPRAWPNLRIIELGDALLGRGRSLVAAAASCYRARIAARPQLVDAMIEMGRARELYCAREA